VSENSVLLEQSEYIAIITLNRPDRLNAMSSEMRVQLGACLDALDDAVKVLVLRGSGSSFCAGADLSDTPDTPMGWRDRVITAQSQHHAILRKKQIIIAAVQGSALGGGASLALAADIMIMSEDAKLGFPFVKLGVVPDGGAGFLLQMKAGPAIALDLFLSAGTLTADEARRVGLTRRVVAKTDLEAASLALAEEIARFPAEVLMLTKSLCAQSWASGISGSFLHEVDAFGLAATSDSHKAALALAKSKLQRSR
jgi:enoyl-CoA hydratase/carnithine racemase